MKNLLIPAGQPYMDNLRSFTHKMPVFVWTTESREYVAARWLYDKMIHAEIMRAKNDAASQWHKREKVWFFTRKDWEVIVLIFEFINANIMDMGVWEDGAWLRLASEKD